MKLLVQRVIKAEVFVTGEIVAIINNGLLVFVGIAANDDGSQVSWLARKLTGLRIFADTEDKMNLSVEDVNGSILLVSQFTLCADTSKGRRPDFFTAAEPVRAKEIFNLFTEEVKKSGVDVKTGIFGASMQIHLVNDGPATFILERV